MENHFKVSFERKSFKRIIFPNRNPSEVLEGFLSGKFSWHPLKVSMVKTPYVEWCILLKKLVPNKGLICCELKYHLGNAWENQKMRHFIVWRPILVFRSSIPTYISSLAFSRSLPIFWSSGRLFRLLGLYLAYIGFLGLSLSIKIP